MFVIDSSVFLSYLFRDEKFHNDAKKFFQQIMDKKIKIFFPISVVCEILHVAYRKSGNLKIRDRLYGEFIKNPMFKIINNESSFLIYFSSHHHKFDIKSAGLCIPVAVDQIYTLKVVA